MVKEAGEQPSVPIDPETKRLNRHDAKNAKTKLRQS